MNNNSHNLNLRLAAEPGEQFTDDQREVLVKYIRDGRLAVSAGAGAGKTTILAYTIAERVLRIIGPDISSIEEDPFEKILAVTFGRDAAANLKSEIEEVLRAHEEEVSQTFDTSLWGYLRASNHICTIDSSFYDLASRAQPEIGLPEIEHQEPLQKREIQEYAMEQVRSDLEASEALETLEQAFEDANTDVRELISRTHQQTRSMGLPVASADASHETTYFSDQFQKVLCDGADPPFDQDDVNEIAQQLCGDDPEPCDVDDSTADDLTDIYEYNIDYAEAVETVYDEYDRAYTERTLDEGLLSHTDIKHILLSHLKSEDGEPFAESLDGDFDDIYIDEFQDTSKLQLRILKFLVQEASDGNNILLVGDVKQLIYYWRMAIPGLFGDILDDADKSTDEPDPHLGARGWVSTDLQNNFRSVPPLVRAGNQLFDTLFTDEGRGAYGQDSITPGPLNPYRNDVPPEPARIRFIPNDDWMGWNNRQAQAVARAVKHLLENKSVTVGSGDDERRLTPGDIVLLFRSKNLIDEYRKALERLGIPTLFVKEEGLFGLEEISYIIDILEWLITTDSSDALENVLKADASPVEEASFEHVEECGWDIESALNTWPPDPSLADDRDILEHLSALAKDLRWDRQGSKAELLDRLITKGKFESLLLCGDGGSQRQQNLQRLVEEVASWEEDGLISYREFIQNLGKLRRMATDENDTSFRVATKSDPDSDRCVNFMTAHSAKGLEFKCVGLVGRFSMGVGPEVQDTFTYAAQGSELEQELALLPRADPDTSPSEFGTGPGDHWVHNNNPEPWEGMTFRPSKQRDDDGGPEYSHPFDSGWEETVREFWRLVYVSYTRASEYLLVEIPPDDWRMKNIFQWSSMGHAFREVFEPDGGWDSVDPGETFEFSLDSAAQNPLDDDVPDSVPVTIQQKSDVSQGTPQPERGNHPGRTSVGSTPAQRNTVPFRPAEVVASSVYDWIACPRKAHERHSKRVSDSRGQSPGTSNAPAGQSASGWGDEVHDCLEELHERVEAAATTYKRPEDALTPDSAALERLLESYEQTDTWDEVRSADDLIAEPEDGFWHPFGDGRANLSGKPDLAYEQGGEWTVVDFKSGTRAASSYHSKKYRSQLRAYAWLLEQQGASVTDARLVYLESGSEVPVSPDLDAFSDELQLIADGYEPQDDGGPAPRPDLDPDSHNPNNLPPESRCGSCGYTSICPAWED